MNHDARVAEIETKLKLLRAAMAKQGEQAVRLRGVDWFAWATAGGSSVVIMTAEVGVAEVLITLEHAFILTDRIEAARLREEEIPGVYSVQEFPWAEANAREEFVRTVTSGVVVSDRPRGEERPLPREFLNLRLKLLPSEVDRYRTLGRDAAEAMREAMAHAEPGWSELLLAGAGADALWARGIEPTLVLVAGEERLPRFRHAVATRKSLGQIAMMVFCGRRHGLYANLTRFVAFRELASDERRRHDVVAKVEAVAFERSRPGNMTCDVLDAIADGYAVHGRGEEILNHHQGGLCGYLSREEVAVSRALRPDSLVIEKNMALAWNPSLPGAKIEDTVLVTADDVEILTEDREWPHLEICGRIRPDVWVRT